MPALRPPSDPAASLLAYCPNRGFTTLLKIEPNV
jgi:hypothetical protein